MSQQLGLPITAEDHDAEAAEELEALKQYNETTATLVVGGSGDDESRRPKSMSGAGDPAKAAKAMAIAAAWTGTALNGDIDSYSNRNKSVFYSSDHARVDSRRLSPGAPSFAPAPTEGVMPGGGGGGSGGEDQSAGGGSTASTAPLVLSIPSQEEGWWEAPGTDRGGAETGAGAGMAAFSQRGAGGTPPSSGGER